MFGFSVERTQRALGKAATRTGDMVKDAVDTYLFAARESGGESGGELKRVALRKEFTIVTDTARRMSWLGGAVLAIYATVLVLAMIGSDALPIANHMLMVGIVAVVVLVFVTSLVFAFVRSDQKVQQEFVKYHLGQTITDELLEVADIRSALKGVMEAVGEAEVGGQAQGDRAKIDNFIRQMALKEGKDLFGLHDIQKTKERLATVGSTVFGMSLLFMGGIIGLSLVLSGQFSKMTTKAAERRAILRQRRQLAMNDVAVASPPGTTWSRSGVAEVSAGQASVSPLSVVYHAPFGARSHFPAVALSDTSVLLLGGAGPAVEDTKSPDATRAAYADVWRCTKDATRGWVLWSLVAASTGWGRRWGHQVVRLSGGALVLYGGRKGLAKEVFADVWASGDGGATWSKLEGTHPPARYMHGMTVVTEQQVSGDAVRETIHVAGGRSEDGTVLSDYWVGVPAGSASSVTGIQWTKRETAAWGPRLAPALCAVQMDTPKLAADVVEAIMKLDVANRSLLPDKAAAMRRRSGSSRTESGPPTTIGTSYIAGRRAGDEQGTPAPAPPTPAPGRELSKAEVARIPAAFQARLKDALATKPTDVPALLTEAWRSYEASGVVLAGGVPGPAAGEEPAGLSVFRSSDGGLTWAAAAVDPKVAVGRVGAAMASTAKGSLVMAGGQVGGLTPTAQVLSSTDSGATWKEMHPDGGTDAKLNSLRRRAFHAMVLAGGNLVALGGDASGTPEDELPALGITASGLTTEVDAQQAAASDTVSDSIDDDQTVMLFVLCGAAAVLLVLLLIMQFWYYRRFYKSIPKAYVKTENAWRSAIKKVQERPLEYDIGQLSRQASSLQAAASLAKSASMSAGGGYDIY